MSKLQRWLSESQLIHMGLVTGGCGLEEKRRTSALLPTQSQHQVAGPAAPLTSIVASRVFLFVGSLNTSRSLMAEAICADELSRRLNSLKAAEGAKSKVEVVSAGLSAAPGSPMQREAQIALRKIAVEGLDHNSQALTPRMVERAERIFCISESQRQLVMTAYSASAEKVMLLDPKGDLELSSSEDTDTFLRCANQIKRAVCAHLDELGFSHRPLVSRSAGI